ncbi:hypothetical protein [Calycomorphotria hydatis]|uniref:Uncharacterized protein n=1 Tax=Calycomorphotria hydatis TaxID=2528027 RepID=A0A517T484_9PLAN|nr:hypothetical protein [Calycomorphotria hydatis]QDT63182.1 hypothetical protein V22_04000 [Calycomorphotria hydatis]
MQDLIEPTPLSESSLRLLAAYAYMTEEVKTVDPEHDGRLERLRDVDGIEDDELPLLHGQLLAAGLIDFDLSSRDGRGVYSITPDAKQALANQTDAA